tara:strand:- start:1019 stop:1636 length:618 start_codon:yes stop_codon:yes gene_type:complete
MIYYPIQSFVDSGIDDILLVCGGNAAGEFLRVLGNGEEFGLKHLHYTYQSEPRGIADALGLAEDWADGEPIAVLLADNILENDFADYVESFESGARIFLTEVERPEFYGVVEVSGNKVISIEEKPKRPKSNLIAIGLYMYDGTVWEYIRNLEPSARGELEITDLNNHFLAEDNLDACKIDGFWADCGESFEGYMDAANKVMNMSK